MRRLNPEHIQAVADRVNGCPYFRLLSMQIVSLEPGRSLLKAAIENKHLQPYGIVHGGVYSSMIDAASFWASYTEIEDPLALTTVEMKLNYLAPATAGVFMAEGQAVKTGKTICLSQARITDQDGRLLAQGTATMLVLDSLQLEGQPGFPRKFLD